MRNVGVAIAIARPSFSREWNRDALHDRRPAAGDEHVRIDHLGFVRGFVFRNDLFCALSDAGLSARGTAGHACSRCLLVHQMPIAMPSSIDPLVPVLRDNFWLTIHVLTITLSYAAFALAMGFRAHPAFPLRAESSRRPAPISRCISGSIASFNSVCFCSPPGQFSAASGRIIPGDVSGAGTRKRRGR